MKETSRRAIAYQQRNHVRGLCVLCPAPALLRVYIEPETGACVYVKRTVYCAQHWKKAQARYQTRAAGEQRAVGHNTRTPIPRRWRMPTPKPRPGPSPKPTPRPRPEED